jgi:threonine dehydrogenase-like Zn-dependent dehydrogenase
VRVSQIAGPVVVTGIPDGDAYTLPASEARGRGLKIKFVRRMGDDYARAIDLVSSGRVNLRAVGDTSREPSGAPALHKERPSALASCRNQARVHPLLAVRAKGSAQRQG